MSNPHDDDREPDIMADPDLDAADADLRAAEPVDLDGLTQDDVKRLSDSDLIAIEEMCRKEWMRRNG